MTFPPPPPTDPKSQLRKTMGFWDVLLFNIATVLGPRWIAAAGHNGTSSISLWVIAAIFFSFPALSSSTNYPLAFQRRAVCTSGPKRLLVIFTALSLVGPTGFTLFSIFRAFYWPAHR